MGKAANRRKIAARRNEKPNSLDDRVKLAAQKGRDNLSAMYLWHESEMELARAEHAQEFEKLRLGQEEELKKYRIKYELKIQKAKNERDGYRAEKSDIKKQLGQTKEWVNLIVASQLTQNKRNTLLVSKAAHIGIFEARDFIKIDEQMEDDEKCEEMLINPLIDLISQTP